MEALAALAELVGLMVQAVFAVVQLLGEALGVSFRILAKKPVDGESRFSGKRLMLAFAAPVFVVSFIVAATWYAHWRVNLDRRSRDVTLHQVNVEVEKLAKLKAPDGRLLRHPNAELDISDSWRQLLRVA